MWLTLHLISVSLKQLSRDITNDIIVKQNMFEVMSSIVIEGLSTFFYFKNMYFLNNKHTKTHKKPLCYFFFFKKSNKNKPPHT